MSTPSTAPVTDSKTDLKGSGLEDDLRKMILGNVTISNEQSNQTIAQGPHQQHFRGRGRGRGGFFRGRGGANFQTQAGHGQHSNGLMTAAAALHSGMRGSPQQVYNQHAAPFSPTAGGFQTISDRRQAPRAPKQLPPQTGAETTGAPAVQPPRILQRPQTHPNANPLNAPHRTINAQHYPRQYGLPTQHISRPIENPMAQANYLDQLASEEIPKVEITMPELEEKEAFRSYLEGLCQKALSENSSSDIATISLVGFGSLASGFATPGSDMDLAVVPSWKNPFKAHEIGIDRDIPRLLEKVVLDANMGARLLTRTRVPILKVCQNPDEQLYRALSEERQKWDDLPEEEKYAPPPPPPERSPQTPAEVDGTKSPSPVHNFKEFPSIEDTEPGAASQQENLGGTTSDNTGKAHSPTKSSAKDSEAKDNNKGNGNGNPKEQHQRNERPWLREKVRGPLDFPKTGVGIQCDINFENPLGIHNTQLLRCYSRSDPRVRPIVLFVKAWAKQRKINSSYSGTLSSYGWVLMVLHYLVNIAQPPVCPNLQSLWRPPVVSTDMQGLKQMFQHTMIAGYAVRFWRNEDEIMRAASLGQLTQNHDSIGTLLRGFFQYYASINSPYMYGPKPPSFYWTSEVLSLRTPGGVRAKSEKGWTGAKTTISNGKEVRHRYLLCIEDPFELDHNVARTVTHKGIVAIRDEFRRTWRILSAVGRGQQPEGGIFDEIVEQAPPPTPKKTETAMETEQKPTTTGDGVAGGEADGRIDGPHMETKGSALVGSAV